MASKIKINTKTLSKDKDSIEKDLKQIEKKIKQMKLDVAAMNKMWTGEANTAFNKAFNDDIDDLNTICDSIRGIITYESTAKDAYEKCEQQVSSLISSISI